MSDASAGAERASHVQTSRVPASRVAIALLIVPIRLYQWTLSPILGRQCRFHPTCSHYAVEALRVHGVVRGVWLTARRLARCHPFGKGGFDPVPLGKG
jgi:uncharacterized protein